MYDEQRRRLARNHLSGAACRLMVVVYLALVGCQTDGEELSSAPMRADAGTLDDAGGMLDADGTDNDAGLPEDSGRLPSADAGADAGLEAVVCPSAAWSPARPVMVLADGRDLTLLRADGRRAPFATLEPPANLEAQWFQLLVRNGRVLALADLSRGFGDIEGVVAVLYDQNGNIIWRFDFGADWPGFAPILSPTGSAVFQSGESEITYVAANGVPVTLPGRRAVGLSPDGQTVATIPFRGGSAMWWTPATGAFDLVWPLPSRRAGFSEPAFDPATGRLAQLAVGPAGVEIASAEPGRMALPIEFRADTVAGLEVLDVSRTGDVIWRIRSGAWILTERTTRVSRPLEAPGLRPFETCFPPTGGFDATGVSP